MSFTHPRRTTKTTSTALTPSTSSASGRPAAVKTNMSLQKGATFHSPSTPERELPYHFRVPSLPRRSQSSLDDVVDAHKRRVALTLGDIDRSLSAVDDLSPTVRQAFPDEADPVPQSFLNHTVGPAAYDSIMEGLLSNEPASIGGRVLRPRHNRRPSRYADSGLGSSIASEKYSAETAVTSVSAAASAITRSAATHSSTLDSLPRLSARATNRIHEHILKPLLAKSSLKDFHPVVKDCPRRIHEKEIVCLRDLEKTLIFMAPVSETQDDVARGVAHWFSRLKERTKSAALYLDFCLTSIRCIQATVEYLNETEQTRPSDRPYSNGYFVDLVDQIKQYAQQVQAAKEKEEKGEKLDEMDPESYVPFRKFRIAKPSNVTNEVNRRTDEVKLHGGLTKNGRPAELVRVKKNGKAISIATGMPVDLDEDSKAGIHFKRSLSEEAEDDESILRSMARRKRSASAAELAPKRCREPGCDKEFKRPCDLTKHEKTHSRPWKCPVESCKYHEYGWPTEKEMDRHHNDKHEAAPPMYECHFKPCAYRSKRESNCKQHMEKAHGWQYVRSKNNGKNRDSKSVNGGLPTPQTTNIHTPSSNGSVVNTPFEEDLTLELSGFDEQPMYTHPQDALDFPEYNTTHDVDMYSINHQLQLDFSPISELNHSTSSEHSPYVPSMGQEHFQENFDYDANPGEFQPTGDFNLYDSEDLYSANVQLPTPSHEIFQDTYNTCSMTFGSEAVAHISPIGHGNTMLYTPTSLREVDEGFEDFLPTSSTNSNFSNGDFQLFPNSTRGPVSTTTPTAMFGEVQKPQNLNSANLNFPGVTAQELLDFYTASTHAAINGNHHNINQGGGMDWSPDDQYSGY